LVGNYGVPKKEFWESEKIQVSGLIVCNYIDTPSHHAMQMTLGEWFKKEGVPLLENKDTRALTQKLRSEGVSLGKIIISHPSGLKATSPRAAEEEIEFEDPNLRNLVAEVSTKEILFYGEGSKTIVLIDCGVKRNTIRRLVARKFKVAVVPWDTDVLKLEFPFEAVVISNGPGDPQKVQATIDNVKKIINQKIPTFGICLGNQILALALGGTTYKMKFGHRSQNQPVVEKETGRAYLTTQNHGFAVKQIPEGFIEWFHNANDNTNEGVIHKSLPFMSVQFHPESSPGPLDTDFVFDYFFKKAGIDPSPTLPFARGGRRVRSN
jgi:carbamoyl-phosphate synthase small subunit